MAKKRTEALLELRSKHSSVHHGQGIGYFVPDTVTRDEWTKLRKKWDKILRNSGHAEIEQFSTDCSGHFSPYFFKNKYSSSRSGSARTEAMQYRPETAEYYRRMGLFFYHAPLRQLFRNVGAQKTSFWTYWHIVRLLKDGATYQSIADFFGSTKCPPSLRGRKTYFFAYHHIERPSNKRAINRVMLKWYNENIDWLEE